MKIFQMAFAFAAAVPTLAGAQTDTTMHWPIPPGARIRVLSPALGSAEEIGTALAVDADTLVFRRQASAESDTLSKFAIKRLDVSTGVRSYGRAKGGLLGMAIGVVGGAVLGYATYHRTSCPPPTSSEELCAHIGDMGRGGDATVGGALLGFVGAVTGAIVGGLGVDTWAPVKIR
jgi:hypothetical protein